MNADYEQTRVMHEWLRYAEGDLVCARVLSGDASLPARNACYLAQQCAGSKNSLHIGGVASAVSICPYSVNGVLKLVPRRLA